MGLAGKAYPICDPLLRGYGYFAQPGGAHSFWLANKMQSDFSYPALGALWDYPSGLTTSNPFGIYITPSICAWIWPSYPFGFGVYIPLILWAFDTGAEYPLCKCVLSNGLAVVYETAETETLLLSDGSIIELGNFKTADGVDTGVPFGSAVPLPW